MPSGDAYSCSRSPFATQNPGQRREASSRIAHPIWGPSGPSVRRRDGLRDVGITDEWKPPCRRDGRFRVEIRTVLVQHRAGRVPGIVPLPRPQNRDRSERKSRTRRQGDRRSRRPRRSGESSSARTTLVQVAQPGDVPTTDRRPRTGPSRHQRSGPVQRPAARKHETRRRGARSPRSVSSPPVGSPGRDARDVTPPGLQASTIGA